MHCRVDDLPLLASESTPSMSTLLPGSNDDVRRNNLARIVRRLHIAGSASRSELVSHTGLNRSTVGALVAELAEAGLVSEQAGPAGSVGRPSLVVVPEAESAIVLAFDFRVDRIVAAVIGLGGRVLLRTEERHRRSGYGPDLAVRQMLSIARSLLRDLPASALWVGTAIGVPGIVDASVGLVKLAPNLGWIDVPIGSLLADALAEEFSEVPATVIGNDADFGAIAEHTRGAAAHAAHVIYLSGEIGIGGGIVVNGQPLTGTGGFGGEVGHMVIDPEGAVCRCGARGCWETLIGRDAILGAAEHGDLSDITDVVSAARHGSESAQATLEQMGRWLGIGLRNLVNIFNPEVVVLGGHLGVLLPEVDDIVNAEVQRAIPASRDQVRVLVPGLGEDSTLYGAGESAFVPLLTSPLETLDISRQLVAP